MPRTGLLDQPGRDNFYGRRVKLAPGRGGLALNAAVETGIPPNSTCCLAMLDQRPGRHHSPTARDPGRPAVGLEEWKNHAAYAR